MNGIPLNCTRQSESNKIYRRATELVSLSTWLQIKPFELPNDAQKTFFSVKQGKQLLTQREP